jgi:hypothetical protein
MNERAYILNMLAEGKITPEEASRLLEALGADAPPAAKAKPQWLKIRVIQENEEKVKINLPFNLARLAVTLLPASAMMRINEKGIDLRRLLEEELPEAGKIVDIHDKDHTVEVYVE